MSFPKHFHLLVVEIFSTSANILSIPFQLLSMGLNVTGPAVETIDSCATKGHILVYAFSWKCTREVLQFFVYEFLLSLKKGYLFALEYT